jgi:hypothetical protein
MEGKSGRRERKESALTVHRATAMYRSVNGYTAR